MIIECGIEYKVDENNSEHNYLLYWQSPDDSKKEEGILLECVSGRRTTALYTLY